MVSFLLCILLQLGKGVDYSHARRVPHFLVICALVTSPPGYRQYDEHMFDARVGRLSDATNYTEKSSLPLMRILIMAGKTWQKLPASPFSLGRLFL